MGASDNQAAMVRTIRSLAAPVEVVRRGASFDGGIRFRIGVPVASVIATILVIDALREVFPAGGVFLLLLVPVLVASVGFGARSGVLALLLGAAGALLVAAVRGHPWLEHPTDLFRVVPYACIGGFIILVGEVLRASVRRPGPVTRLPVSMALVEPLTERELEVLGLAASGLTTDEIAGELVVSRNTVKSHLRHAYGKLGVRNRAEAVAMALHAGAIDRAVVTSRVDLASGVDADPTARPDRSRRQSAPVYPPIRSTSTR